MTLLDTDILVDVIRGHAPAVAWFRSVTPLPSVTGLSVMELIQGARNQQDIARLMRLVRPLATIWPSEAECDFALATFARTRLSHGVELVDALIASVAYTRSATLLTFNTKHYRSVTGLMTQQPYVR